MKTDGKASIASMAPLVGGLAACCTVHLLVIAGVIAGVSGFAVGGITLGVGVTVATAVWLAALWLRRRTSRSADCRLPAAMSDADHHGNDRFSPAPVPGSLPTGSGGMSRSGCTPTGWRQPAAQVSGESGRVGSAGSVADVSVGADEVHGGVAGGQAETV